MSNYMKVRQVGGQRFYAEGRADKTDLTNLTAPFWNVVKETNNKEADNRG